MFARSGRIDAFLPLAKLTRLAPLLADTAGQVQVELRFGLDEEGRRHLQGELSVDLQLTCQRCLQALSLPLRCELSLLVFDDQAQLSQYLLQQGGESMERDVLVLAEVGVGPARDELDLPGLVEDELMLSLPLVPVHVDDTCNTAFNKLRQDRKSAEVEKRPNPFAVLAQLKKGQGESSSS